MSSRVKKLKVSSEIVMTDGTILPVSDADGNRLIDPDIWQQCQARMLARVSKGVTDIIASNPERRTGYGLLPGQTRATVSLLDILGTKKAPNGDCNTVERKEN